MSAWTGWEEDVLAQLGYSATSEDVLFLATWHTYEQSACRNNPLNTTQQWPFASDCNSVGVKSYGSQSDGAKATAATLKNGNYPDILAALKSGNPFAYAAAGQVAKQVTTWGTPLFAAWYTEHTGTPQQGTTSPAPAGAAAPLVHRGYADLRNSLNRHLPKQLERSRKTGETTLRALSRLSKVKR